MKSYDLQAIKSDLLKGVDLDIDAAVRVVTEQFKNPAVDNALVSTHANINGCMAELEMFGTIKTVYSKHYDNTKKRLDMLLTSINISTDVSAGTEEVLYQSNVLRYKKKRNNDSDVVDHQVLILELNRLGVSKEIIDKALAVATKKRRGNTYYIIEGSDD